MLEFFRRLGLRLTEGGKLREELFLQNKSTVGDLMNTYLKRSRTYMPLTGMTLTPGTRPIRPPTPDEMRKASRKAGEDGTALDTTQWMPDHAHWFLNKDAVRQREDFAGYGGMFCLFMEPDAKQPLSMPEIPKIMRTHPALTSGMETQFATANALKDDWLPRSKALFGEPFHDDPSYDGLQFVLPLLTANSVLDAAPDQRAQWLSLFSGTGSRASRIKGCFCC